VDSVAVQAPKISDLFLDSLLMLLFKEGFSGFLPVFLQYLFVSHTPTSCFALVTNKIISFFTMPPLDLRLVIPF
jgi:hypothetical protein